MDDTKRLPTLAAWLRPFSYVLPCSCTVCGKPARTLLCASCRTGLSRNEEYCAQCAEALPCTQKRSVAIHFRRCGRCIANPPDFQSTHFAYDYHGAMLELVQRFKFGEALILNHLLADMITNRFRKDGSSLPDALIPVPLHPARLKQRGFNQSLELARVVGKTLNLPVDPTLLIRTRNTANQSGLNRKYREKNIKGAFKIQVKNSPACCSGKHLALIDDVITTGSTIREAAKALKCSGADRITVLAVAKTRRRMGFC